MGHERRRLFSSDPSKLAEVVERQQPEAEILTFKLSPEELGKTYYNPSRPFEHEGKYYLLARVESLEIESDSVVALFSLDERAQVGEARIPNMQDPYFLGAFDEDGRKWLVFGGVSIAVDESGAITSFHDVMYKVSQEEGHPLLWAQGRTDIEVEPFIVAPEGWKDTRFIQLQDGTIGVFPRPQGEFGGRGKIGYFEVNSLDDVQAGLDAYAQAADETSFIEGIFSDGQWAGANQLLLDERSDDIIHIIGHRAQWLKGADQTEALEYKAIHFAFDRKQKQLVGEPVEIAQASYFGNIKPKTPSLRDVVFPAGVEPIEGQPGQYWLYAGVGDANIGRCKVKLPGN